MKHTRSKHNSLAKLHPQVAKSLHPDYKRHASTTAPGSKEKLLWICRENDCSKEFWSLPIHVVKGRVCPNCAPRVKRERQRVANQRNYENRNLEPARRLSVLFPELTDRLHPDDKDQAENVAANSRKKLRWVCPRQECGHVSVREVRQMVRKPSCLTCTPKGTRTTPDKCFATIRPELAKEIHPDDAYLALTSSEWSRTKVRWICPVPSCRHEYTKGFYVRSSNENCPACAGKVTVPQNSLAGCYPNLVKELYPDDAHLAHTTLWKSDKKLRWVCQTPTCGYIYSTQTVLRVTKETKCPACNPPWHIRLAKKYLLDTYAQWSIMNSYELEEFFTRNYLLYSKNQTGAITKVILSDDWPEDILAYLRDEKAPLTEESMKPHPIKISIPSPLRRRILREKGEICLCCGSKNNITLDHIFPESRGGETSFENLEPLCLICNSTKKARIITRQQLRVLRMKQILVNRPK